ncbi:MAG: tetratricopeptide repeat protein [Candidatus Glassbacteria bacterium]|nr:tetratricopeptide repeat protein [Candidatus Glassbacteria bacterium]
MVLTGLAALAATSPCSAESRRLNSDHPQALRLFEEGLEQVDAEQFDRAAENFRQAVELDPGFMQAHFRYMDVLRGIGRNEQMIEEYRKQAEQNPKSARCLYLYGRALEDLDLKRARYRDALQLDPGYYWAQYGIGAIYLVQRRYDEAIIAFNKTLEMNPQMVEAIHLLGTVYLEKGMPIQARERFEEAAAIDSTNHMIYLSLGQVYSQMDRYESAEKAFRQAAAISPKYPMTYYYLGLVCELQGRNEQAVIEYENFLRLAPGHELSSVVTDNIKKLRK